MKKMLVVLLFTVLAVVAFADEYQYSWEAAVICGNKSGTDDTTFVNAPDFSHAYGVAVAGNGRVFTSSYYGAQRYDKAIMVWDPEFGVVDTVGPEIEWNSEADTIGLCRFMQTTGDGNVAYADWTNDMITVFDQDDYSVVARSAFGPNTGGGLDAFVYDGEQYYITQQILGSTVIVWDADFNVVDTLRGGGGGRNVACVRDGSVIISPSLGGVYFVEFAGNPDDGWVADTVYLEDISVDMGNLMYVSNGPNDYIWLFSRDAANDGVYVVDPGAEYATKLYTNTDSTVAPGTENLASGFSLGMAVDNQYVIWLAQGLIDTTDHITTLGYQQPWELRAPCQVAFDFDGTTEYLYLADFYGYTLKLWTRTGNTAVWENTGVIGKDGFKLDIAYPNPFNPAVTIPFTMFSNGDVKIEIYDVAGKKIETLVNDYRFAGTYEVRFDGSNLASGNYLVKMTCGNESVSQKISLVK